MSASVRFLVERSAASPWTVGTNAPFLSIALLATVLGGCDSGARAESMENPTPTPPSVAVAEVAVGCPSSEAAVCCGSGRRRANRLRCRRRCTADAPVVREKTEDSWVSLFDGKTLAGWEVPAFGGEGEVTVEDGSLVLDFGNAATGVKFKEEFPKTDYEIRLEAKRVDGFDFFCGLTFPVGESCATFVVGGWSGGVVGISCIDGFDASENETTRYQTFETDQWYNIRVKVTDEKIQAWIDGEPFADVVITDRRVDTRPEVDLCRPLGITSWNTKAAIRNIRYRRLPNEGT